MDTFTTFESLLLSMGQTSSDEQASNTIIPSISAASFESELESLINEEGGRNGGPTWYCVIS